MSSVYEDGVECPLCGANTAHSDLDCRTHERLLSCERCGFYYETRIVERNGMSFWEMTEVRPISRDATKVAVSDGDEGPKWNAKEFDVMPGFKDDIEVFGVEDAASNEAKAERAEKLSQELEAAVNRPAKPKNLGRPGLFEEEL